MALWTGAGINPEHILEYIIRPVLDVLDPPIPTTPYAMILLLGTAWIESRCGQNLHQEPGPAASMYQVEPATYASIIKRLDAPKHAQLRVGIESFTGISLPEEMQMHGNLYYATAIARTLYWLEPSPLPKTLDGMYLYYLKVWKPGKKQPRSVFVNGVLPYLQQFPEITEI